MPMLWIRRWRAGKRICTDQRTRSSVELSFEIGVKKFVELGAVLQAVGSIPPHSPKFGKGRSFFAVGLKPDKINEIAGDVVIRDSFLAEDRFVVVF